MIILRSDRRPRLATSSGQAKNTIPATIIISEFFVPSFGLGSLRLVDYSVMSRLVVS